MGNTEKIDYAVLLLNMGGPKTISEIQPFLYNLFSDKDIISFPIAFLQSAFAWLISRIRAPKTAKLYQKIGGGSPILAITTKQAVALENELTKSIKCKVIIGMRYTAPFISTAIKEIMNIKPLKLVLLPLYPHYSTATTLSSFNEVERVMSKENTNISTVTIKDWFDYTDYIKAISFLIKEKLKDFTDKSSVHLVFSAHSLPMSIVKKGDPYPEQINICVNKVIEELSCDNPFHICYQSKVGPVKWLDPSTEETITKIASMSNQDILMIPISFVSDHFEVNYEIDILYAEQAKELGINHYARTESLNDNPLFIKALSNITLNYISGGKA